MQVSATSGTTSAGPTPTAIGQLGKEDFLKLLLAQMKNQDPMKPMDDTQFVTQLAQFTMLEKLQEMDQNAALQLQVAQLGEASKLVGKEVEGLDGTGELVKGTVTAAKMVEGSAVLLVGDKTVALTDLTSVKEVDQQDSLAAQAEQWRKELAADLAARLQEALQ